MRKESRNEAVEAFIRAVRGHRVVLDADLARLYGVTTRVLNQAMKRNAERFPSDFAFELTLGEAEDLKSQSVPSSSHGGRRKLPWAFTEHGAIMAANILRSERAVQMSVFVVRAFVRLREQVASNEAILRRLTEIDKTLLQHDTALRDLYQKLLPLLQPRADPPKRRIGFHTGDD